MRSLSPSVHAVHRAWQPRGAVHPFRAPHNSAPALASRSLSRDECKKEKKKAKAEHEARRKRETESNGHRPTATVVRILFARGK